MENIKEILDSQAGLLFATNDDINTKVEDNRFELLKKNVDSIENKNDSFYAELIALLSDYLNKLYDSKIKDFPRIVFDKIQNLIKQNYDKLNFSDIIKLEQADRDLAENLFEYVCDILKENKDIKLSKQTLTNLLNRSPKLFSFSIEQSYLYRSFDFAKLVKIIKDNQTVKKSNISIDEVYQLLIDTCQLNNPEVFVNMVTKEDFKENHKKITELLNKCNANAFKSITDIIVRNFDENFDRLSIVKERKEEGFKEDVIIHSLKSYMSYEDCDFIHQILIDDNINIDYKYYYADYFGDCSLKSFMAFSENKIIVKDLLSKEENIQDTYWYGESKIQLYRLYAIIGEYEKALENFNKNYNYALDFTEDFSKGFNDEGYAAGSIEYKDSLVAFIKNICNSFDSENVEYITRRDIISRILNSENVKYINLEETLPVFQKVLKENDFKLLLDALTEKYNSGNLEFIVVNEEDDLCRRYAIRIASDEQVQELFSTFNNNGVKKLIK